MKYTDDINKLYLESVNKRVVLDRNTTQEELSKANSIVAYHACASKEPFLNKIKNRPDVGVHAGSLFQAVWRADYKVNDEGDYDIAHIHELVIEPKSVYPQLVEDSGYDQDQGDENQYKGEYDLLMYHNTGEGHANESNLSVIVLDHSIIKSSRLYAAMNSEEITKYMEENN
jgi:hypothetical protein